MHHRRASEANLDRLDIEGHGNWKVDYLKKGWPWRSSSILSGQRAGGASCATIATSIDLYDVLVERARSCLDCSYVIFTLLLYHIPENLYRGGESSECLGSRHWRGINRKQQTTPHKGSSLQREAFAASPHSLLSSVRDGGGFVIRSATFTPFTNGNAR